MGLSSIRPQGLPTVADLGNDVFSQKVGDWAFNTTTPTLHNEKFDIPHGFCAQPQDSVVMDYLDGFVSSANLPVAHLYNGALQRLTQKITDPTVAALLQQDCELHAYLHARKIGDVYE